MTCAHRRVSTVLETVSAATGAPIAQNIQQLRAPSSLGAKWSDDSADAGAGKMHSAPSKYGIYLPSKFECPPVSVCGVHEANARVRARVPVCTRAYTNLHEPTHKHIHRCVFQGSAALNEGQTADLYRSWCLRIAVRVCAAAGRGWERGPQRASRAFAASQGQECRVVRHICRSAHCAHVDLS